MTARMSKEGAEALLRLPAPARWLLAPFLIDRAARTTLAAHDFVTDLGFIARSAEATSRTVTDDPDYWRRQQKIVETIANALERKLS